MPNSKPKKQWRTRPARHNPGPVDYRFETMDLTAHDSVPGWQTSGLAEVERDHMVGLLGHDDFAPDAEQIAVTLTNRASVHKHVILARDPRAGDRPASVLGAARLNMPSRDNTHMCWASVTVRAEHQRHGIGTALWRAAWAATQDAGRTTMIIESAHLPGTQPEPDHRLHPAAGTGYLDDRDGATSFARAMGLRLMQVERQSTQMLPIPREQLHRLREGARPAVGPDYEVLQWTGATPHELVPDYLRLLTAMSTDAPMGGLDYHEEVWDERRLQEAERAEERAGRQSLTAAARHRPSGRLVGYTQIQLDRYKLHMAHQENTVVLRPHRGHRLGLLLKVANVEQLQRLAPQVRRVYTWNAAENEHMLAVNTALGYRLTSLWGAWQYQLAPVGGA